jgi:hypothetical protein
MVHALPILAPLYVRRGSAFNWAGDPTLIACFNTKWDKYIKEVIDISSGHKREEMTDSATFSIIFNNKT